MGKYFKLGLFMGFVGVAWLLVGFHNIDLSFNFMMLEHELGYGLTDTGFGGIQRSTKDLYVSGAGGLFMGFLFMLISILCLIENTFHDVLDRYLKIKK